MKQHTKFKTVQPLHFPVIIQPFSRHMKSDEGKEKNQIFQTNIIQIVWQTVRRITSEILGFKGLKVYKKKSKEANENSEQIA